jgi:glycosyltransferase involved in cell wall biosynthesis
MQRLKILHVITGLKRSGAEKVLLRLAKNLNSFSHTIVSLTAQTPDDLTEEFTRAGIPVFHLNMQPHRPLTLFKCIRLFKIIHQTQPDIMQTWMYHADVIGGLIGKLAGVRTILWNIRNGTLPPHSATQFIARLASWFSRWVPTAIISCSKNAITFHNSLGYTPSKFKHIPNGIDCDIFFIDKKARTRFRENYHLPNKIKCVGLVARWHAQKDIPTFLKACHLIAQQQNDVRFIMIGHNLDIQNSELTNAIQAFDGLNERMLLLGAQNDIPALMNSLDVLCMTSSFGEGFPNVIGEAMACGINCVATDVGDAAEIIHNMGYVAPIGDAKNIAQGVLKLLNGPINSAQLREHILQNYSLEKMTADYAAFYNQFGRAK